MRRRTETHAVRTRAPAVVFAIFALAGCAYIFAAKTFNVEAWVVTGVPVLLMLAYMALSATLPGLRLHDEQVGDNLYYMGFLYTLTSLGTSLYTFSATDSTDDIFRNFGVAVASTIAGVALRIFYNQMRRDPLDVERATRHELAEMSRRIRTELDTATKEFATFRRVSNQMLQEGFDEVAKQAEASGKQIASSLETLTHQALSPIRDAAERINAVLDTGATGLEQRLAGGAARLEEASGAIEQANVALAASVERFASRVDEVGERLASVKNPDEVLKMELTPVINALGGVVAEHARRLEALTADQQMRTAETRSLVVAIGKVAKGLETSARAAERSAEAAGRAATSSEELSRALMNEQGELRELANAIAAERNDALAERIAEDLAARLGTEFNETENALSSSASDDAQTMFEFSPLQEVQPPEPHAATAERRFRMPWG